MKDLSRSFGTTMVVRDLNLSVRDGEVFGFLGPNGAGKTTTVRMLTCLIGPTGGTATVDGLSITNEQEAMQIRARVGLLTETPGMYDTLSASKNLRFYGRLYDVDEPALSKQIEHYLKMLGLWDRRDDLAGGFSKGMRQKLAICRALIHEPKVLFLDEPTSGLDPEAAKVVHDFIGELKSEGRTIFLCTHNLDEADRLSDRIGVMKQRMIRVDTPSNLRAQLYGRRVAFHVRTEDLALVEKLRDLPFARNVQPVRLSDGGSIVVDLDDPNAQNPVIVRRLVECGADVRFVGELRHSLEDVYLRLINA